MPKDNKAAEIPEGRPAPDKELLQLARTLLTGEPTAEGRLGAKDVVGRFTFDPQARLSAQDTKRIRQQENISIPEDQKAIEAAAVGLSQEDKKALIDRISERLGEGVEKRQKQAKEDDKILSPSNIRSDIFIPQFLKSIIEKLF